MEMTLLKPKEASHRQERNSVAIAEFTLDRKSDLILIMTPEKQDKTLELSKHWSVAWSY